MYSQTYLGGELDLFSKATRWKRYFAGKIKPYIVGNVLEVGAGIGSNIPYLWNDKVRSWTSLEPDPLLAEQIPKNAGHPVTMEIGILTSLPSKKYDCLIYIDVLEHIEEDRGELENAANCLNPGGKVVILVPAHQFLYSPFDKEVGHFRRYDKRSLLRIVPSSYKTLDLYYLDSVGYFLSCANRFLLGRSMPTTNQIALWNNVILPISKLVDPLIRYSFGKSVVMILERT